MPQSLAKILVHTIFSTKNRQPFLKQEALRSEMHSYLGGILNQLDCEPLIIGGVEDHVHLLLRLCRVCTIAEVVKELKRGSSLWIKERDETMHEFAWQSGYGAFSIGFSQLGAVRRYIAMQPEHHRYSFADEFRRMLARYEVAYDERYVWD